MTNESLRGLSREPDSEGPSATASETVLGGIAATARLDFGSERVRLLATNLRLIVAHLGKRGTGALAGSPVLGKLSGGVEELFMGGLESRKKKTIETLSPAALLADKYNFDISYRDIVQVELENLERIVNVMVLTKNQKFQFVTLANYESVISLFRPLADRVKIRRRGP